MTGKLIDRWFPVAAVDHACSTRAGSGRSEKALFTWFASRPVAQARAAVICSLLPDRDDEVANEKLTTLIDEAIRTGDPDALADIAAWIPDVDGARPVVLDCFSGRGILPLEAARLGLRAVGIDDLPVAVLASRVLADYPLRDWSAEPDVPYPPTGAMSEMPSEIEEPSLLPEAPSEQKLLRDVSRVLSEVGRRTAQAMETYFPRGPDGQHPWGYLWAITIPCDRCRRRFPLVGSLVVRHPYKRTADPGQHFRIESNTETGTWRVVLMDGVPEGLPTIRAAPGRRGKSAWCPFADCGHPHPLETVKAKGRASEYQDIPLLAADVAAVEQPSGRGRTRRVERKVFRHLDHDEVTAATSIDVSMVEAIGSLSAIPDEPIAPGNNHAVRGAGYGYLTWASLMNARQRLQFAATVRAIRDVATDLDRLGVSSEYLEALSGFAAATVVRRLRRSTRGAKLLCHGKPSGTEQNRCQTHDIFSDETKISFNFDWFETGIGSGPGSWASVSETGLRSLAAHLRGLSRLAVPARFRQGSARSLPYRDSTVDAVVTDPPYYQMIDYADVSDLFYVWVRRALHDVNPELFADPGDSLGLQSKAEELIVKDSAKSTGDHRTVDWYETEMLTSFREIRRVLKPDGTLSVVFGHSDPEAWRRLLGALREAQFVVTSAWPSRSEGANTGVASIKVTVTIGCRRASALRPTATVAQVEREIVELVRSRVPLWDNWDLALSDQRMAAYGPAMEVVGRYQAILRPDGTEPDLDHFLTIGRRAVADAHSFKIDELPLDTFDAQTRVALFWLRAYGRTVVPKGEARFEAQAAEQRIEDLRGDVLTEARAGYTLALGDPGSISDRSSVIHIARALAAAWPEAGTEGAAQTIVESGRDPDDAHLWATVAELVSQLPESSSESKSLTACQRNRTSITAAARRAGQALTLDFDAAGGEP